LIRVIDKKAKDKMIEQLIGPGENMRPQDLKSRYAALRAEFDARRATADDFADRCAKLMAQDAAGNWWTVDTRGRLHTFDQTLQAWKEAEPSAPPPPFKDAPEPSPVALAAKPKEPGATVALPALPTSAPAMLGTIFAVSLVLSYLGWDILGLPPQIINTVIPTGGCTGFTPATTGMYICSAFVGLRVVFGSLVLAVVMVVLRKPITAVVNAVNKAAPVQYRSILPAVVAAMFFAVIWSGSHVSTGSLWGIVPHRAFPAIIGALTYVSMTWGPGFIAQHATLFDARDKLPKFSRWLVVFATPTVISLLLTAQQRVSSEAFKQQFVVIVGMVVAYLAMTPRSGNLSDLGADLQAVVRHGKAT
jgi:hypothetical protein